MAEASMGTNGQQVVDRIGFAERWLDRAKRQCASGDMPRGMLTLVLANAEMTHALRMAGGSRPSRRMWWVFGVAFAAACSMAVVALARWQIGPAPVSGTEVPIIVTFKHQPGGLLGLVDAVPRHASATAVEKVVPQKSPARIASVSSEQPRLFRTRRSLPPLPPTPAFRANSVQHPKSPTPRAQIVPVAPVPSEQRATEAVPSDVELINLVLTAERTLRTPSRP